MDNSTSSSRAAFSVVLALLTWLMALSPARADVCVWRDPERTMQRLFPAATDYKTVTTRMTPALIAEIEKNLGVPLEASEKKEFDTYNIIGNAGGKPQKLGTVLALAGKGEYGTIEVVIGVDGRGKLVGAYIQRTRERASKALQSPEFLNQFAGKTKNDGFDGIKPASADAVSASRVVAFVIKKMLVFHDVLTSGENKL